ncbi:MAG TPA: ABC transporter permease [Candidatus Sulfotelmatobacter sp.]|nr:ABC transporter permease [Candidatus Sulfotelmatobacter sp.]
MQLSQDLRFAFRQMVKAPGFSLTAILSLALGIGATVSVFSVLYSAILNAWPYAGFDRVCQIDTIGKTGDEGEPGFTGPQIRQLRQTRAVEDVVGIAGWNLVITGSDVPEDLSAVYLTGNGFPFFGMPAMLGRYFGPSDAPDAKDPEQVAVLSYKFWRRHFNGDPSVVGKNIQLVHKDYTILGVLPPRFTWRDADIYLPHKMAQNDDATYEALLKLKPGVRLEAAETEIRPLMEQFDKQRPNYYPAQFRIALRKMGDYYVHDLRNTLLLLLGAVALLLLIGCSNVSILLLARGTARQHELAIRSAVGASRFRIVRQLLTESLLLALLGAGLGVLLSYQALEYIVARLPQMSFPHEADFQVNVPVLLFSVVLAILSGVIFGVFPALDSARREINQIIQSGTHKVAGSVRGKRMHTGLIAGQIALTLLLLTAAGAAIRGFSNMLRRPLGYDPHHVMSLFIPIHENTLNTWEERSTYITHLRERVAAVPGVVSAGISANATPPSNGWTQPFEILGKSGSEEQGARVNFVSPEYFTILHIPVVEGRLWEQSEVSRGATLALVNQAFVHRYFPGEDVLNHSVRISRLTSQPPNRLSAKGSDGWLQVIGVVGDAIDDGLDKPVVPGVYLPYSVTLWMGTQILVRTQGAPLAMLHGVRQAVAAVNPDQQIAGNVDDLETWIIQEPEYANSRLISILFSAFSGLALALAGVGLYSVVSYSVAQRTSEFGIRIALGAQRRDVLRIVVLSACTSVGIGLVVGLILSLGLGKVITRWVQTGTHDPLIAIGVSTLVIAVAGVACLVPAFRALAVDPMKALRSE